MIRIETKGRARALQLLYAWELTGEPAIAEAATGLARLTGPEPRILDRAEALAEGVVKSVEAIDRAAAVAAENWRLSRIATVERNILRLAIHELQRNDPAAPPKVVIDEAVQLAHWFGGARAPAFVNGVLDRVARELGVL
ncbi:MAG TPA: transcription antitermination factor NusB [Gemmatimonadales bacterium]|nr:transcription antitermination factor NusB [Gemmatimonadales bacterium]